MAAAAGTALQFSRGVDTYSDDGASSPSSRDFFSPLDVIITPPDDEGITSRSTGNARAGGARQTRSSRASTMVLGSWPEPGLRRGDGLAETLPTRRATSGSHRRRHRKVSAGASRHSPPRSLSPTRPRSSPGQSGKRPRRVRRVRRSVSRRYSAEHARPSRPGDRSTSRHRRRRRVRSRSRGSERRLLSDAPMARPSPPELSSDSDPFDAARLAFFDDALDCVDLDQAGEGDDPVPIPADWLPYNNGRPKFNVTAQDVAFTMSDDANYFDGNTYIVFADNGDLYFMSALMATIPTKKHRPGVGFRLLCADGDLVDWTSEYKTSDVAFDDDGGASIYVGEDHEFVFEEETGSWDVHLSATADNTHGDVNLRFQSRGGCSVGDGGRTWYNQERTGFQSIVKASTWSLVTGTVAHPDGTVTNVSGHGIVNHVNRNVKPHKTSPKLELVKFFSPSFGLICDSMVNPYDPARTYGRLILSLHGVPYCATGEFSLATDDPHYDDETGYTTAQASVFTARGTSRDGKAVEIELDMQHPFDSLLDKEDILARIPWLLRVIIKRFIAAPWVYRWRTECQLSVTIDGRTRTETGVALREIICVYNFES